MILGVLVSWSNIRSAELFLEPFGLELGDEGLEHQIQITLEDLPSRWTVSEMRWSVTRPWGKL